MWVCKKSESGGQPESEGYIPRKEEIEGTIIMEPKKCIVVKRPQESLEGNAIQECEMCTAFDG